MRNISTKTDNVGDTLPADDFNANLRSELQNLVTSGGFSLDPEGGPDSDVEMLGKTITLYSNASQYYVDSGAADAYSLARTGTMKALTSYVDGVVVLFKAANANTGASTINVDSLGIKDLVDNTGSALAAGAIVANGYVTARYNSSTDDFEIITTGGRSLFTWENVGDDLLPVVSGTGTLGSTSQFVEGLYLGDTNRVWLGADQDLSIYHNNTNGLIRNETGDLILNVVPASNITFRTTDTNRWVVGPSGNFLPYIANAYDIGDMSYLVKDIYQADGAHHYLGADLDLDISHDGSNAYITNNTGNLNIYDDTTSSIVFWTSGIGRWNIDSSGYILPFTDNSFDIGSATYRVREITSVSVIAGSLDLSGSTIEVTGSSLNLSSSSASVYINSGGSSKVQFDSSGNAIPVFGSQDLGSGTDPWDVIYYNTLSLVSDKRAKCDFSDTLGLDFILELNPISFWRKDKSSTARNHGLIAQEVEAVLKKYDLSREDFSGLRYNEEEDIYGLDYTQFIGPIIKAIQEIYDIIN